MVILPLKKSKSDFEDSMSRSIATLCETLSLWLPLVFPLLGSLLFLANFSKELDETGFWILVINAILCGSSGLLVFANHRKYGHSFFAKEDSTMPSAPGTATTANTVPGKIMVIYLVFAAWNAVSTSWQQFLFTDDTKLIFCFIAFAVCITYSAFLCIPFLRYVGFGSSAALTTLGALTVLLLGLGFMTQDLDTAWLYSHFRRHPLSDFHAVVSRPNIQHEVHLEIDDALQLMNPYRINVLAGVPGCGKSVSLFKFLEKQHVIWLTGRRSLCENLSLRLGFKRASSFDLLHVLSYPRCQIIEYSTIYSCN
ncbi:hypothetical protein P9112_001070 [Eukaryota sp. TZLM1-RC]